MARRESSLREVAERAREIGAPEVLVIPGDVSKHEECHRFVEATVNHYGRCELFSYDEIISVMFSYQIL